MAIDEGVFREAMAQLASGVAIISARVDGEDHGFTATSFTSLSLAPMLVLVCIVKAQRSHNQIVQAGHYAVSILGASQQALGERFAEDPPDTRFDGLAITRAVSGAPIVQGCVAWVDCTLREILPGGDHDIFIGEVIAAGASAAEEPLVYHNRRWGQFTA